MSKRNIQLIVCALLVIATSALYGQGGATGTILGTVTDSSGAVVPNASVDITNIATGVTNHTQSSSAGEFNVPFLNPGTYRVTVQSHGFQKAVTDGIGLAVTQQNRVDIALRPGAASETIEIQASGVQLDTDTSSVSQLVSQKQVEELPLNGRNFLNLLFIGSGAVQTVGEQGQMRQGEGNAISINGSRPESNNYTLDGIVNTDTALSTPAVIVSQDAIQEFKVQSATYSAEYGFSANQVNIVTKSGTNKIHGSVFEFNRNDAFDASTHFQDTKPELRQNQFGFVLDGPVWLPKLYDGRNKTFWLANYEGWRIINGVSQNYFVPTQAELNGDFSGSGLPAFGTAACATELAKSAPCMPVNPATGAPFPGNQVPVTSRLATVALAAKLFPAPNSTSGLGNYHLALGLPNKTNQQTYRIDQNMGRIGAIFFRYTKADYANNSATTVSVPAGFNVFTENSTGWVLSHTVTLGQGTVNSFRFGHLDAKSIQGDSPAPTTIVADLGLTGTFGNLPDYARGYPNISFQSLSGTGGSPGNNPTTSDIPTWEFADSLTLIRGRHTFTTGFDYRRWIQKRDLSTNFLGSYGFQNTLIETNGGNGLNNCPTVYCGTANAVADFLLGYYQNASTFQPGPFSPSTGNPGNENHFYFQYVAPFVQDDWKASSKLTVNLGLRWDWRNVPYEEHDKMFWIDPQNTLGGLCFADKTLLTDGIAPAGNGFYRYCGRRNPADSSKLPFAPRFGFAYQADSKTVIRGGYGFTFDSTETREIDNSGDLYPFVTRASLSPATQLAPKLTDNLFPAQSALTAVTPEVQGNQFIAVIISEHPHNPYVQQWSVSAQRELARNTTLELNYVGNKGTHLLTRSNINQPNPPPDPAYCDANPGDATHLCTANSRKPFPQFLSGTGVLDSHWTGYSNYNAFNVKLEHRASDLAFLAVYTYARSMDDKSAAAGIGATNGFAGVMDEHHPALDYAKSDFDVPQRLVASYVYNLPVGRGKKYAGGVNRIAEVAVGGWQIGGIATFQKGFPFSVLANDKNGLLNTFTQRANLVGNPNSGFHKSINEWFNKAAFSQPVSGQFGTSGRNILRQPGINNWDMNAAKNIAIGERVNFQLRVEAFNVFNHTQWGVDPGAPGVGPGTSAVGTNVNNQNPEGDNTFGTITSARPGRILQLGGKITF